MATNHPSVCTDVKELSVTDCCVPSLWVVYCVEKMLENCAETKYIIGLC
jgi:hypothetical protein